jgi:hypothetical protein
VFIRSVAKDLLLLLPLFLLFFLSFLKGICLGLISHQRCPPLLL